MPTSKPDERLSRLAHLVEQDIRTRGLTAGERYLRTSEVAALLGVSTRLANDAMRILAARQILSRRPKAGTLVGPAVQTADEDAGRVFEVVHLLVRHDYFLSERDRMDAIVTGLVTALPGTDIQFTFVPAFSELSHAERLVRANQGSRRGYVIAVKSPQLQQYFGESGLPTVLMGTPFVGINLLSWIDKDQAAIGRIITKQLVTLGHETIAVVLRDRRGYGDDLLLDAVTQEAIAANLSRGALTVRSVPTDRALTDLAMLGLLTGPKRPTAVICRSRMILASAARVAAALRLTVGKELTLALCDPASTVHDGVEVPCIRPVAGMGSIEEGRRIGEMLAAQADNADVATGQVVIPVSL